MSEKKEEDRKVKKTLEQKYNDSKTNKFHNREGTQIENVSLFEVNSDLRSIPAEPIKNKQYVELYTSIEVKGYDNTFPILVDINTGKVATGNRRLHCMKAQGKKKINVTWINCKDYTHYISLSFRANVQKGSSVSELARHIKEFEKQGFTAIQLKEKFGLSVKSIYDVMSIRNPKVLDALNDGKITLRNALILEKKIYKSFFSDKVLLLAESLTQEELTNHFSTLKVKAKVEAKKNGSDVEITGKDKLTVAKFDKEQIKIFNMQLTDFQGVIDSVKLKAFFRKERKDWK